ncbi:MAG: cache domain-containing protein [Alphaproteobacteria bacterium]|nr:cache domain-containing protein [Alphaproteobacteria bacterium]
MKSFRYLLLGLFVVLFAAGSATVSSAEEAKRGTKEEATALVNKAVAYFEANGKEKTLAKLQEPASEFIDRDLYVFVVGLDGTRLANPKQPKLVGTSMVGYKDLDGKPYGDEVIALGKDKGEGWVDYKFSDPLTKKAKDKTAYLKKAGDLIFVCGVYKD